MAKTSRLKKLILLLAALALALGLAAVFLLPRLVDVNRYRPRIEELARRELGRELTLGELGLSVFPSLAVSIDGIRVGAEGEEGGELLEARRVLLGAELFPLLSGRLAIGRIVLEEPTITLRRLEDGHWELRDLAGGGEGDGSEGRVSVAALRLRDASIVIEDAAAQPGSVLRHELSELDLDLSGLDRPRGPFQLELSTLIPSVAPDARLAWRGRVGRDGSMQGSLELEGIRLEPLAAQASALSGSDLGALAGRVGADLSLRRSSAGALAIDGTASVEGLRLPREQAAAVAIPDSELDLDFESEPDGSVKVDRFAWKTGGLRLSATGRLEVEKDRRVLLLEIPETAVPLAELRRVAAAAGSSAPLGGLSGERLRMGGRLRAELAPDAAKLLRLELQGLRVRGLRLSVRREADGRFDYRGGQAPPKAGGKSAGDSSGPVITAEDLVVAGLEVRFEDRALGDSPVVTELTDVELRVDRWLPGKTTPLVLAGRLAGGRARLEGQAGPIEPGRVPLDLKMSLEGLDVAALAPYLKRHAGIGASSGRLDADTRVSGSMATGLSLVGRLDLKGARVEVSGRAPVELDLRVDHDLLVEKDGDRIRLRELTFGLPSGPLSLEGLIELPEGGPPSFDVGTRGAARLTSSDLRELLALVGARTGVELDAREPILVDARLSKSAAGFAVKGRAELRKLVVRHALLGDLPLQVGSADVEMAGERVGLKDLSLRLGATDLSGSASLEGFDRHRVGFDLSSETADLDELFAFVGRAGAKEGRPAGPRDGDALSRTSARGRLRVGRAAWRGLAFTDFDAELSLEERRLELKRSRVKLYGGSADASLVADLGASPASYRTEGSLGEVRVRELLEAGLGYDRLSGLGGGSFRLAGTAGPRAAAVAAATGGGSLALVDGSLGGLNMLSVLKEAELFGESSLAQLGTRLSEEGTSFERLDADYTLDGGVLRLTRLSTQTPEARIDASGAVRLLEQRLDLDARILLSKELSEQMREEGSRAAKYLWNAREDAVAFPCRIVGPLTAPKALIDWEKAIAQYAQAELGRNLERSLEGLLGGGSKEESSSGGPAAGSGTGTESGSAPVQGRQPSAPSEKAPAAGSPRVEIQRARLAGNFLVPDLKLELRLSGKDLGGARIVVSDARGQEIHRDEDAFVNELNAHYAGGASRDRETSVELSWQLDGKRIAGVQDLRVTVTPRSRTGEAGAAVTEKVAPKKLF